MVKKAGLLLCGVVALGLGACTGQSSQKTVEAGETAEVTVVTNSAAMKPVALQSSFLTWKGFKPGGEHFGKIFLSGGEVAIEDGKLKGGYVEIAMASIKVEDLEGEMAEKLKAHLENEDFFEANVYPTARFEITDLPEGGVDISSLNELKGNLTLKGVTKNISIPIESIDLIEDTNYTIQSKTFSINRADWNVKYGSKSFFADLGDKFISDDIELSFTLIVH